MKIAVFVNIHGNTIPYHESGIIALFEQIDNQWQCTKRTPLSADTGQSIADVRARIHYIISEIDSSKVFVVEKMKSLQISVFDGFGITVWEHKGNPEIALDYITEQELKKGVKKQKSCCDTQRSESTEGILENTQCGSGCKSNAATPTGESIDIQPQSLGNGAFKIDIAQLMANDNSLNSRQILMPILHYSTFSTLEIVCEHLPRWFGMEIEQLQLKYTITPTDDKLCHVVVSH